MQTLNLINPSNSTIKYSISRFPDGEVQITLDSFSHKDRIEVICRVTNAEELFILMQVMDILDRHEVFYSLFIYYLMGARMDRVMDFNRPFTLKIIINILDNSNAEQIAIFRPHSETALDLGKKHTLYDINNNIWYKKRPSDCLYQIIVPDAGAAERFYGNDIPKNVVVCSKVRDVSTGKILSIKVDNPEVIDGRPLLIVDDLCDGGGTFVGIAKAVKAILPNAELNICIYHIVNPEGIKNLSRNFNHVWFSNSYKTWENLPENVTQIEIV